MPKEIKISIVLLFLSAVVAAFGTHLDMDLYTDDGNYNPYIYTIDFIWLAVIFWIVKDLIKKKRDIRSTVLVVGLIIVGFNAWDYLDYGLTDGFYAYVLESIIYVGLLIILNSESAKGWYVEEKS